MHGGSLTELMCLSLLALLGAGSARLPEIGKRLGGDEPEAKK